MRQYVLGCPLWFNEVVSCFGPVDISNSRFGSAGLRELDRQFCGISRISVRNTLLGEDPSVDQNWTLIYERDSDAGPYELVENRNQEESETDDELNSVVFWPRRHGILVVGCEMKIRFNGVGVAFPSARSVMAPAGLKRFPCIRAVELVGNVLGETVSQICRDPVRAWPMQHRLLSFLNPGTIDSRKYGAFVDDDLMKKIHDFEIRVFGSDSPSPGGECASSGEDVRVPIKTYYVLKSLFADEGVVRSLRNCDHIDVVVADFGGGEGEGTQQLESSRLMMFFAGYHWIHEGGTFGIQPDQIVVLWSILKKLGLRRHLLLLAHHCFFEAPVNAVEIIPFEQFQYVYNALEEGGSGSDAAGFRSAVTYACFGCLQAHLGDLSLKEEQESWLASAGLTDRLRDASSRVTWNDVQSHPELRFGDRSPKVFPVLNLLEMSFSVPFSPNVFLVARDQYPVPARLESLLLTYPGFQKLLAELDAFPAYCFQSDRRIRVDFSSEAVAIAVEFSLRGTLPSEMSLDAAAELLFSMDAAEGIFAVTPLRPEGSVRNRLIDVLAKMDVITPAYPHDISTRFVPLMVRFPVAIRDHASCFNVVLRRWSDRAQVDLGKVRRSFGKELRLAKLEQQVSRIEEAVLALTEEIRNERS